MCHKCVLSVRSVTFDISRILMRRRRWPVLTLLGPGSNNCLTWSSIYVFLCCGNQSSPLFKECLEFRVWRFKIESDQKLSLHRCEWRSISLLYWQALTRQEGTTFNSSVDCWWNRPTLCGVGAFGLVSNTSFRMTTSLYSLSSSTSRASFSHKTSNSDHWSECPSLRLRQPICASIGSRKSNLFSRLKVSRPVYQCSELLLWPCGDMPPFFLVFYILHFHFFGRTTEFTGHFSTKASTAQPPVPNIRLANFTVLFRMWHLQPAFIMLELAVLSFWKTELCHP